MTPNGFALDDSGQRVVVDPICRIEGHLRIEVNLDANNVIRNAVSTGNMWRGLEIILKGRDPRDAWAFTERMCGVCTGVRGLHRGAGSAPGCTPWTGWTWSAHSRPIPRPPPSSCRASPPWPKSSPGYFRDVQARLKRFVESGQLGPFSNAYWGNPAYKLPAEANLMAVTHYLEALDFQKEIVKIHTIFGGRNPHPNWLVGGMPCSINVNETGAVGAVNMAWLNQVSDIIDRSIAFVDQVYIPDLKAIAAVYKDWNYGGGLSSQNLLAYGEFPDRANDYSIESLMLPGGAIVGGDLATIHEVDPRDPEQIQEFVAHSWYRYPHETQGLHPWDGVTEPHFELGPNFKGKKTHIEELDENGKYSWIKAPRWRGHAMEVGPLARFVVAYARGDAEVKEQVDGLLHDLDLPLTALFSTLGRTAARALECSWAAHKMRYFQDKLMANIKAGDTATANMDKWEPQTWPSPAKGVGHVEAPRGALGHWIHIADGKLENYQAVVPTTWNASPRDPKGNVGAYEAALLGTPLAKADEPLEILRTIHSFDPCLACATHVIAPDGQELAKVKVR
jgi:hydrogenase large subunit